MTAPFHPLLICLMRELAEADEALKTINVMIKQSPKKVNWKETYEDCWQRMTVRDDAAGDVLSHLLIMPHAALDTSAYERLWAESLALPEDERENGRLWDAVEDVAQRAIELYRGMK